MPKSVLLVLIFCTLLIARTAWADPSPRWGATFIYDPVNDNFLLFGGAEGTGGAYVGETWIWDREKWIKIETPGPSPRGFSAATFHQERSSIILHGGRGVENVVYSDTWGWDGKQWTLIEDQGPYQADHHKIVFVPGDNFILGYGGWIGGAVTGVTWKWNGTWEVLIPEDNSPPKRASFGMDFDLTKKHVLLFGGLWLNGQYADFWTWDNILGWKAQSGPYEHSSLDHHTLFYDYSRKQALIFGGKDYRYRARDRTIEIGSENQFSYLELAYKPTPRHSFGLAYDTKRNQAVLFGGKAMDEMTLIPLNDLWIWDGETWSLLETLE